MTRLVGAFALVCWLATSWAIADVSPDFWARLALSENPRFTLSIKYKDRPTRETIAALATGYADFAFVRRLVANVNRDQALSLANVAGVEDVEVLDDAHADFVFQRLVELYRVYLYRVSDGFNISVVNFSQGVEVWSRNQGTSGERTIAEALDALSSKLVPVLVAAGDGPDFGMGPWTMGSSILPVVATNSGGKEIDPLSARPQKGNAPWRLVLYADGVPAEGSLPLPDTGGCGEGAHLTSDQMWRPEEASVPAPGGSSFATFRATWNICFIHQYTEVVRAHLSAMAPAGPAPVDPFIAYYVDSPVSTKCPALKNRWADQRFKFGPPAYSIEIANKQRLQDFIYGNAIELRVNYSLPILQAFLRKLPPASYTDAGVNERYVSSRDVLGMLRALTLGDLIDIAANPRSANFERWKAKAAVDRQPILSPGLVDAIGDYCRHNSLFLALSDIDNGFLASLADK